MEDNAKIPFAENEGFSKTLTASDSGCGNRNRKNQRYRPTAKVADN